MMQLFREILFRVTGLLMSVSILLVMIFNLGAFKVGLVRLKLSRLGAWIWRFRLCR